MAVRRLSFYDRRKQWAALPLGELHDYGKCAHCGIKGEAGKDLRRTILMSTHAAAMVCADVSACIRHRRRHAA